MSGTEAGLFSGVQVDGLRELRNAMKRSADGSQKALTRHLKPVASSVADVVRGRVPVSGGRTPPKHPRPWKWPRYNPGDARASVRAFATQTGAGVRAGGESAPYYPWLEFGGSVGRRHKGGAAWSGVVRREWLGQPHRPAGRYIYPVIAEKSGELLQAVMAAIDEAELEAGWERA